MPHLFRLLRKAWAQSFQLLRKSGDIDANSSKRKFEVEDRLLYRLRFLLGRVLSSATSLEIMDSHSIMVPPDSVRGMTVLNKEAFSKKIAVPAITLAKKDIAATEKVWKALQLRCRGIKPIAELSKDDPLRASHSLVLLDPEKLVKRPLSQDDKDKLGSNGGSLKDFEIQFLYENWSVPDIMRAVLPSDADNVASFSQIGHIAHLNLRPESMPYKSLIGQVILDKISTVKSVVNKINSIDNTYRNFQMELLAGEDNYITQLKEHNCIFELDFSKVYWNSRLSTEHNRIVQLIKADSVVYDVFAGIGPFAIPLARKKRNKVFANDLNPSSYEYLQRNVKLNKITLGEVQTFNMDGKEFIQTIVKTDLIDRLHLICDPNSELTIEATRSSYVIMNLPGLAIEFLGAFNGLLHEQWAQVKNREAMQAVLPTIFCYTFSQKSGMDIVTETKTRAESALGYPMPDDFSVKTVRNVAPNKDMLCLSFKLWPEVVLGCMENKRCDILSNEADKDEEPESKKQKLGS